MCARSEVIREVDAKHGLGKKDLVLLHFISSIMEWNERVREVVSQYSRFLIGDGRTIDFWFDDWTDRGELRLCFPRIFTFLR